jgi:hypothetical protein
MASVYEAEPRPKADFYKYVSPETGRIVLKNRTLRWSTPADAQ